MLFFKSGEWPWAVMIIKSDGTYLGAGAYIAKVIKFRKCQRYLGKALSTGAYIAKVLELQSCFRYLENVPGVAAHITKVMKLEKCQ